MTDEVWEVISQTIERYKGITATAEHRRVIESLCSIEPFNGGAFVIRGNEIDLFVTPQRRGRWATRGLLDRVIGGVIRSHGSAICAIHKDNAASISLARRLGFTEFAQEGDVYKLRAKIWKSLAA
jgi:hypothetical protein